jgi:uncharacterized protein YndB with AHSA1/START domain
MIMTLESPVSEDEVFILSRTFDASKALFWDVLTKEEHLGTFLYGMQMPTGLTMWGKWVFREINAPDSIAYVVSFCNEAGEPVRHPMAPLWPLEVLAVQTLEEKDGKTIYESRSYPINATPEERAVFKAGHSSMQMGFGGTFAQLAAYLVKLGAK